MAVAVYRGTRPEVTLGWPDGSKDGDLRPWPIRGSSKRNLSLTLERGRPTEAPPLAALWLCAVRRREGPWFTVRFHKGEYELLCQEAFRSGWLGGWLAYRITLLGLFRRVDQAYVVRAEHALRWTSPAHVEQFVEGCRKKYQAWSSNDSEELDDRRGPVASSDPLFG